MRILRYDLCYHYSLLHSRVGSQEPLILMKAAASRFASFHTTRRVWTIVIHLRSGFCEFHYPIRMRRCIPRNLIGYPGPRGENNEPVVVATSHARLNLKKTLSGFSGIFYLTWSQPSTQTSVWLVTSSGEECVTRQAKERLCWRLFGTS